MIFKDVGGELRAGDGDYKGAQVYGLTAVLEARYVRWTEKCALGREKLSGRSKELCGSRG